MKKTLLGHLFLVLAILACGLPSRMPTATPLPPIAGRGQKTPHQKMPETTPPTGLHAGPSGVWSLAGSFGGELLPGGDD